MSELDRLKEQLVYLRFWIGIMVATEIALVGWLISTPLTLTQRFGLLAHSGPRFWPLAFFSYIGRSSAASTK